MTQIAPRPDTPPVQAPSSGLPRPLRRALGLALLGVALAIPGCVAVFSFP